MQTVFESNLIYIIGVLCFLLVMIAIYILRVLGGHSDWVILEHEGGFRSRHKAVLSSGFLKWDYQGHEVTTVINTKPRAPVIHFKQHKEWHIDQKDLSQTTNWIDPAAVLLVETSERYPERYIYVSSEVADSKEVPVDFALEKEHDKQIKQQHPFYAGWDESDIEEIAGTQKVIRFPAHDRKENEALKKQMWEAGWIKQAFEGLRSTNWWIAAGVGFLMFIIGLLASPYILNVTVVQG
jgi:hypothetical protein